MSNPLLLTLPDVGTVRLHPDPLWVPDVTSPAFPPKHRFDDPEGGDGGFSVRYTAENLRGSLLECLAQFRSNDEAAALEAAVQHGDDSAPAASETRSNAVRDYLSLVRIGRCVVSSDYKCVSIHDPGLQADLDTAPRVRRTLESPMAIAALGENAHLDEAIVRLGGPVGRAVTQACAKEIYTTYRPVAGIHHLSRHDDQEACFAIFHDTTAEVCDVEPLDPALHEHRQAVRDVLTLWKIAVPNAWK